MAEEKNEAPEKRHVFDNPRNVKAVIYSLFVVCALLFGADYLVERYHDHPWENLFAFYAVFGFVACVFLVLAAKEMRKVTRRKEDYYDE